MGVSLPMRLDAERNARCLSWGFGLYISTPLYYPYKTLLRKHGQFTATHQKPTTCPSPREPGFR